MMHVGNIVRMPTSVYGEYGIVEAVTPTSVTVRTKTAQLVYEPQDVNLCATIKINVRRYSTSSGNRFHVCHVLFIDGTRREAHVQVRAAGDLGEETRAYEIRKLVFAQQF